MTTATGEPGLEIPQWDVADRMRKCLRAREIGVQEMAEYFGVARNTISNWINGRIAPSTPTLRLWALRCGVPFEWLRDGVAPGPDGWAPRDSNPQPTDYKAAVPDLASRRSQLLRRVIVPLRRAA